MTKVRQSYGERESIRAAHEQQSRRDSLVRAAIKDARRAEVRDDYERVAEIVLDYLAPTLVDPLSSSHLHSIQSEIGDDYEFDGQALWDVVNKGRLTERALQGALRSLEAVAMQREIVSDDLRNFEPVTGFASRMGQLFKTPDYEYHGDVQLASYHSGETKTLYQGETGEGKSTTLATEKADRWAANCADEWFDGDRYRSDDIKIIDLIDTDEFENSVADIPLKQSVLREVRLEMGLPVDFTEMDDFDQPNLEVLVPMTTSLEDEQVPFDPDGNSPIQPFTIPASYLTKRSLKHFIAGSTKQQQQLIGTCYDRVEEKHDDWSLEDLTREVLSIDGISDSFKRRALHRIENLQAMGFVRDEECPYAIDWDRIFNDTETITAFSQAFMNERDGKLMILAYLFHAIYNERVPRSELPNCVAIGRELHEVVPHSQEANGSEREQALQDAIIGELSYTMRKNRHEDLELIFDTQDITDIKRGIRKRFNRAITFQTHEDALEELFDKVVGNKSLFRAYRDSIQTSTRGRGTVLGKTVPNNRTGTAFLANVQFAPPPWEVFDDDEFDTGLHERVAHLDEEWDDHDWDCSVPDRLELDVDAIKRDIEEEEREEKEKDGGRKKTNKEIKEEQRKQARDLRRAGMKPKQIVKEIGVNPNTGEEYSAQTIYRWTDDVTPGAQQQANT